MVNVKLRIESSKTFDQYFASPVRVKVCKEFVTNCLVKKEFFRKATPEEDF